MASSSSEQKVVVYHIHHHFVYYFADAEQQAQQERQVKGGMGRRAMMQTLELVHAGSERAAQAGVRLEGTARCRRHLRLKAYRFAVRKHASAEGGYALLRFKNEKKKRQAQTQGDLEEGEVDASFPLLGALVSRSSHGDHCGLDLHTAKPGGGTDHLALVFDSPSECDRWEAAVTRASGACSVDREEVKEKVIHEEEIIKEGGKERMGKERMEKERMEKERMEKERMEEGDHEEHQHRHVFHRRHEDLEEESQLTGSEEQQLIEEVERNTLRMSHHEGQVVENVGSAVVRTRFVHHVYRSHERADHKKEAGHLTDLGSLRQHLRWAVRLELAAIPPYLYAMYSIVDKDSEGYKLVKSIAVEEMLHVSLAANLLTSVGGVPSFYDPAAMVQYPFQVPHHRDLVLPLAPLSTESLEDVFLKLEQPCSQSIRDMRASQVFPERSGLYATIGELYRAIEGGFERLSRDTDLFANPRIELQMKPHNYKNVKHTVEDSGGLTVVTDLRTARSAISTIMHQGEGVDDRKYADAGQKELTHYYKLLLLREGFAARVGAVYPCLVNPKTADFSADLQVVSCLFNASYAALMLTFQELYQEEDVRGVLHQRSYTLMECCLRPAGQLLCATPHHPGALEHAGPTFEPYVFDSSPLDVVQQYMEQVMALYPTDQPLIDRLSKGLKKLTEQIK